MQTTHEDSDETGYCRGCGTTIGEDHHADCELLDVKIDEIERLRAALREIAEHSVCCDARHIADKALTPNAEITGSALLRSPG